VTLWRLSNHSDLSGAGGMRASGRWHSIGRPIVYLAEHPSSCLVEALAHALEPGAIPSGYQWLEIAVDTRLAVEALEDVPAGWAKDVEATRTLGDLWLERRSSALLRVPSAWSPATSCVLLNPRHPDAARVTIARVVPLAAGADAGSRAPR
jgi:RES domain-containing protein